MSDRRLCGRLESNCDLIGLPRMQDDSGLAASLSEPGIGRREDKALVLNCEFIGLARYIPDDCEAGKIGCSHKMAVPN